MVFVIRSSSGVAVIKERFVVGNAPGAVEAIDGELSNAGVVGLGSRVRYSELSGMHQRLINRITSEEEFIGRLLVIHAALDFLVVCAKSRQRGNVTHGGLPARADCRKILVDIGMNPGIAAGKGELVA